MRFNIVSYIEGLRHSLERLPTQARIAFSVWCADALFQSVSDYLEEKGGHNAVSGAQEALDYLWGCASGNMECSEQQIAEFEAVCGQIAWAEEVVRDDEQARNVYAIEAISSLIYALDACRTGSAASAAKAAESAINKLDRQISEELKTASYSEPIFSHPVMRRELQRHAEMLEFLQACGGFSKEQRLLFRQ